MRRATTSNTGRREQLHGHPVHRPLLLLLPHSSHLLQPLDVGVFTPFKKALANRQSRLFCTGVRRIEKAEWLEHFIEVRKSAISEKKILAGWRGAGLFPENLYCMLHQFSITSNLDHDSITIPYTSSEVSLTDSITTPYFLTSSPPPWLP